MIAIVDYCKGNLKSVERGFQAVGGKVEITSDPVRIAAASGIVLPGVGAFADASATMRRLGQLQAIRSRIDAGVPFLGICLGLHLMFDAGVEGAESENACGLALLPGVVTAMPKTDAQGASYKIPHVGWNSIELDTASSPLLEGTDSGEHFYFTHSYVVPDTPCTVARTTHSVRFPSVVSYRGTAFGVQFHPEKSSDAGLVIVKNFCDIVKAG